MLDDRLRWGWRWVQALSLVAGVTELVLLFRAPAVGIHVLWNVLIPLAPLVVMFVPGIWRNVCPLGVVSQVPRRLGLSVERRMTPRGQAWAVLLGCAALLVIVPMRHLWFDLSGPATGVILILLGIVALLSGLIFEGKSGWCSTGCPVHVVEKLYGRRTGLAVLNAHCDTCTGCVRFCPDSHDGAERLLPENGETGRPAHVAGHLIVGGFVGYVYGWFQCPDLVAPTASQVFATFAWPFGGMIVSLACYALLLATLPVSRRTLSCVFAAMAIAVYYWFRIPMLFGFGPFEMDGCLVDLRGVVTASWVTFLKAGVVAMIGVWLIHGLVPPRRWMRLMRPPVAPV